MSIFRFRDVPNPTRASCLARLLGVALAAALAWTLVGAGPASADDPDQRTSVEASLRDAVPPANDDFADAETLTGSSATATGTNVDSTGEPGEPAVVGRSSTSSVWYSWTAPAAGRVTIDLSGSNFDTMLAVYTGAAVDDLDLVGENDDDNGPTSRLPFQATAGTTYGIVVVGYNTSDVGTIALALSTSTPGPSGSISGTVTDSDDSMLDGICVDAYDTLGAVAVAGAETDAGVYRIDGLAPGNYTVEFVDCGGAGLRSEWYDAVDHQGQATSVTVVAGQATSVDASLRDAGPPANDNFADAETLTGSTATTTGTNVDSTGEPGEADDLGAEARARSGTRGPPRPMARSRLISAAAASTPCSPCTRARRSATSTSSA